MVKASLLIMVVLTILAATGLRWRESRSAAAERLKGNQAAPRRGWVETQKRRANRWITAAAIAAVVTLAVLGGLQWLRVWQG